MNGKEIIKEFEEYVMNHDLDEEECEALEAWVNKGNSPYANPDHYCMDDEEISFMEWYWILADPRHPEHKNLRDHRYYLAEDAGHLNEWPSLLKVRIEEFLNMDYRDSTLNAGQDWYVGNNVFLSLEETKEHLLIEMEYFRKALRILMYMAENVESSLSDMNLRGNLFADVLMVGDVLGEVRICAEDFLKAMKAIDDYEDQFRKRYLPNHFGVLDEHA